MAEPNKAIPIAGSLLLTIGFIILMVIFSSVGAFANGFIQWGERAPRSTSASGSGSVSCVSWSSAPAGYQEAITKSANRAGVQPALLGAILMSEHGDSFPSAGTVERDGPYQITTTGDSPTWPGWWRQVLERGYSNKPLEQADVKSIEDSSLATAVAMRVGFEKEHITPNTAEEKYITYAGLVHNRGAAAGVWADEGFDVNTPPSHPTPVQSNWVWGATFPSGSNVPIEKGYAKRTWANFQKLNVGCMNTATSSASSTNIIVSTAEGEVGYIAPATPGGTGSAQSHGDCSKYNIASVAGGSPTCYKWCAAFATWVYRKAGFQVPATLTSTDSLAAFFKNGHFWISSDATDPAKQLKPENIKPGDIGIMQASHAVIVKSVNGNKITIIEGNTGKDVVKNTNVVDISKFSGGGKYGIGRWQQ